MRQLDWDIFCFFLYILFVCHVVILPLSRPNDSTMLTVCLVSFKQPNKTNCLTLQNMKPHYDTNSVLMIQIFGMTLKYKALADHSAPGIIKNLQGEDLTVGDEQILGWTAMPLFDA